MINSFPCLVWLILEGFLAQLHKLDAHSISGTMLMGHGEDLKDDKSFTWELNQFS